MNKSRLEAFSDGVLAIIITIMILEIKVPEETTFESLKKLIPVFMSYVLSFIYIGIYWNNHHHLLQGTARVNGKILWANLFMLFWLSLIPFATAWMGENHFAKTTMTVYGIILMMSGTAYWILQNTIIKGQEKDSLLKRAVGNDIKGIASVVLYLIAIGFSFFNEYVSGLIYIFVAIMWFVPDTRIEKVISR